MKIIRSKINIIMIVLSLMLTGCAQHAQHIRSAQDSFSRGAELEYARKFGFQAEGIENPTEEAERYYALALGLVNEAINEGASDLKRDSLYGTALTIRALASWRLGDLQTVKMTTDTINNTSPQEDGTNKVWPRDRALCNSLPTLIKIDALAERALDFSGKRDTEKEERTLAAIILDSETTGEEIVKLANEQDLSGHPFTLYLAQTHCELAFIVYDVTTAAAFTLDDGVYLNEKVADNFDRSFRQRYNDFRKKSLEHLGKVPDMPGLKEMKPSVDKMKAYYESLCPIL